MAAQALPSSSAGWLSPSSWSRCPIVMEIGPGEVLDIAGALAGRRATRLPAVGVAGRSPGGGVSTAGGASRAWLYRWGRSRGQPFVPTELTP